MLNIKHPEADRLARMLANQLGESITEVVIEARPAGTLKSHATSVFQH